MNIFDKIRLKKITDIKEIKDPTIISENNTNILQEAIAKYPEMASNILNLDVNLNHQDNNGQTALHYALAYNYYELAQKIIDKGSNLNISDKYGNGPLWTACLSPRPNYNLIKYMVKHGAKIDAKNNAGRSPLLFAKDISGDPELIGALSE